MGDRQVVVVEQAGDATLTVGGAQGGVHQAPRGDGGSIHGAVRGAHHTVERKHAETLKQLKSETELPTSRLVQTEYKSMCTVHEEELAKLQQAEAENGALLSTNNPSASALLDLRKDHVTQIEHMRDDNAVTLTRKTETKTSTTRCCNRSF